MNIQVIVSWNLLEVSSSGFNSDVDKFTDLARKLDDAIIRELPNAFHGYVCESGHGDLDTYAVIQGDGSETAQVVISEWGDSDGGDLNIHGTVSSDEIESLITQIYNLEQDEYGEPSITFSMRMDRVDLNGETFCPLQGDVDEFIEAVNTSGNP